MIQSNPIPSDERIVDAMIQLARATKSQRMIVVGSSGDNVFLELHRRGYAQAQTSGYAGGTVSGYGGRGH